MGSHFEYLKRVSPICREVLSADWELLVVFAQDEKDFESKSRKIDGWDTRWFYRAT